MESQPFAFNWISPIHFGSMGSKSQRIYWFLLPSWGIKKWRKRLSYAIMQSTKINLNIFEPLWIRIAAFDPRQMSHVETDLSHLTILVGWVSWIPIHGASETSNQTHGNTVSCNIYCTQNVLDPNPLEHKQGHSEAHGVSWELSCNSYLCYLKNLQQKKIKKRHLTL